MLHKINNVVDNYQLHPLHFAQCFLNRAIAAWITLLSWTSGCYRLCGGGPKGRCVKVNRTELKATGFLAVCKIKKGKTENYKLLENTQGLRDTSAKGTDALTKTLLYSYAQKGNQGNGNSWGKQDTAELNHRGWDKGWKTKSNWLDWHKRMKH